MRLRWALAATAVLVVAAAWCAPAGAIIGGKTTAIKDAPYQAAIVFEGRTHSFCGGAISPDGVHVITAAHCVFDNPYTASGEPLAPKRIHVVAGTDMWPSSPSANRFDVEAVSFDPLFDPATFGHDAALLTLDRPVDNAAQPIRSIATESKLAAAAPERLVVSGWGRTSTTAATDPARLQSVAVPRQPASACSIYSGFTDSLMLCAGSTAADACFGDSGGPLVVKEPSGPINVDELVGIVSYGGAACADPTHPGVYTRATEPGVGRFITQDDPIAAPTNSVAPAVQGTPKVGSTVTCAPGAWYGAPTGYAYQFEAQTASGAVARTALGSPARYVVQPGDAGAGIACVVRASNGGGFAVHRSAPVAVPALPAHPPASTTPPPATTAPQQPQQQQTDLAAPVARITRKRCVANRCTLTVAVGDAGFSLGIRTVRGSVRSRYRTTCARKGRRIRCTRTRTRTRTLTGKALSATRFRVTASRLPFGRNVFALVAVDRAGHRQALATRATLVTRRARKR